MALPGREKTFALENCRGLLEKLRREIKRFEPAEPGDVESCIDFAFNIVVTAWHLCDWVFADLTPDQKSRLKISSLVFADYRPSMSCAALVPTGGGCIEALEGDQPSRSQRCSHLHGDATRTYCRWFCSAPALRTKLVSYFVDGLSIQTAEEVFDSALTFWTQFIYSNQIAE